MANTLIGIKGDFSKEAESINLRELNNFNDVLYDRYSFSEYVEYNPKTALEENHAYKIDNFSNQDFCPDYLKSGFSSAEYNAFEWRDNPELHYLINIDTNSYFYQRITQTQLRPKKFLNFIDSGTEYEKIEQNKSIVVKDSPDAFYDKQTDTLYFQKLDVIKGIFHGISELYRETTQQELKDFVSKDEIELSENFSVEKIGQANRKRIAMYTTKYNSYSLEQKKELNDYMANYVNINKSEDGKFIIGSDQDLRDLMYGIDERYYTTAVGNEKRIANSVIPMESK